MNKLILTASLCCMFLTLISFESCSGDSDAVIPNLELPEEYQMVGNLHNEALDFAFEELKKKYTSSANVRRMSEDESFEFSKQAVKDYFVSSVELKSHIRDYEAHLEPLRQTRSSAADILSPQASQLVEQIRKILYQHPFEENDFPQLKKELDEVNRQAAETLTESEAAAIYAATSTAYSTCQYWMINYKKWYYAANYPAILVQFENSDDLNAIKLKTERFLPGRTRSMSSDWDAIEEWWKGTKESFKAWWEASGKDIIWADTEGAATGGSVGGGYGAIGFGAIASIMEGIG